MRVGVIAASAMTALALCGCASVVRGTAEPVTFDSDPPGAYVRSVVRDTCGGNCNSRVDENIGNTDPRPIENSAAAPPEPGPACVTPCTIQIPRNQELVVTFTKDGYESETQILLSKLSSAGALGAAGNVIIGGAIGLGVDAVTGAGLDHLPNPMKVTLRPIKVVAKPNNAKR